MLVEVLATMTISALLLAALFSVASLTLRSSGKIERLSEEIEERTRLIAALSREIERALPVRWAGKDDAFIFNGTASNIAFAVEVPLPGGVTDMAAVFVDGAAGVTRRVVEVGPAMASFGDVAGGRSEVMADSRYRVKFSYFARLSDGREALLDTWPDARQLPVAIQLIVSGRDGTTSVARVKLGVDAEPGCGLPKAGRCSLAPATAPGEEATSRLTSGDGG